ncbi:hypothetical protein GCM10023257_11600 [Streptomyces hyderabadensis]|uniref:Uncharacterized protein n=1 Tax=Streptomyces hyderabadensis TaxID=598549 RepID=A0ABP9HQG3_9ACTN
MLQGGLEDRVDVGHGCGGEPLFAAVADRAAAAGGIEALGAAPADAAEPVKVDPYVLGREPRELLLAEAWDEMEADAGRIACVGVLAELVDGDAVELVREVVADGAVGCRGGEAAVAVGDLLGELGQGFLAGVAGGRRTYPAASQRPSLRW